MQRRPPRFGMAAVDPCWDAITPIRSGPLRVIFYGDTLVVVVICQNFFKEAFLTVFADETGECLFFLRLHQRRGTISIIFIAPCLDLIMAKKPARCRPQPARLRVAGRL